MNTVRMNWILNNKAKLMTAHDPVRNRSALIPAGLTFDDYVMVEFPDESTYTSQVRNLWWGRDASRSEIIRYYKKNQSIHPN